MAGEIVVTLRADTQAFERNVRSALETTRRAREDKEIAHQRRLETIIAQSSSRLQQIEARRQAQLDTIRERGVQRALEGERKIQRETQRSANAIDLMRVGVNRLIGAFAALGAAFALKRIAEAAIESAISIDKTRQTIAALTGGVDEANKKIAELRKLAQSSPGVTTSFATDLFAQFKALKTVADSTINDLIKSIGRLNAVFNIPDVKTFSRNLIQIFQGGFERDQIKEAIQAVPIFEQLLKEAFGTSDGTKLRQLKDAGKLTMQTFLQGMIEQIDERFKDVQDGIGSRFEKLKDRVLVALEPLGEELTKILLPVFDDAVRKVEEYGSSAARVFAQNRNDIIAVAKEITQLVVEISKLIGKIIELGAKSHIIEFLGRAVAETQDILSDPFGQLFRGDVTTNKGPRLLAFERNLAKIEADRRLASLNPLQRQRVAAATGDLSAFPTTAELRQFAKDTKDINLLARLGPEPRTGGGGGGDGGGGGGGGAARSRREAEDLLSGLNVRRREEPTLAQTRIALEKLQEENAKLLVDEFRDRNQRLREQRASRAQQTREFEAQEIAALLGGARRGLTRSGRFIDAAVERGQLTAGEAELLSQGANREFADKLRQTLALEEKRKEVNQANIDNLKEEIDLYDQLGVSISDNERFMRGFNSQIETSGDAFERFGQNVSNAFRNVRDLFNGLKQAVLGFFNDLLGNALQNLVRNTLGGLFGKGGGGSGGLSGIFGNLFRTPSFAGGGDGISAPPSISQGIGSFFSGGGGSLAFPGAQSPEFFNVAGGVRGPSFLGGLGKSFAGAAPLLGLGLGGGLGGQSIFGNILGSAGGFLGGGAVAGFAGALGPAATAFFTNPFTIGIGAALLVGSVLLGKAAQRRRDEEASGQFLTQALQGIEQLAAAVSSGQITTIGEARGIFETNILGTFRQQIGTLKTKSVRESRLTNQVRDLENVFQARIPPLIADLEARQLTASQNALTHSKLIPEFATGGTTRGGIAFLHPGEKVLNLQQQAAVRTMAGPSVFERAGVPGPGQNRHFDIGGTMPAGLAPQQPIEITLEAQVVISEKTATGIYVTGGRTSTGRAVTVNNVKVARTNREL